MTVSPTQDAPEAPTTEQDPTPPPAAAASPLVTADLLVEDVSIDGMCGVY